MASLDRFIRVVQYGPSSGGVVFDPAQADLPRDEYGIPTGEVNPFIADDRGALSQTARDAGYSILNIWSAWAERAGGAEGFRAGTPFTGVVLVTSGYALRYDPLLAAQLSVIDSHVLVVFDPALSFSEIIVGPTPHPPAIIGQRVVHMELVGRKFGIVLTTESFVI